MTASTDEEDFWEGVTQNFDSMNDAVVDPRLDVVLAAAENMLAFAIICLSDTDAEVQETLRLALENVTNNVRLNWKTQRLVTMPCGLAKH